MQAGVGPGGVVVALMLAVALSGCASSSPAHRVDKVRDVYESWPLETRQAVLDGKVELDMSPAMVRVALGEPGEVVERTVAGRKETVWIYTKAETVAPAVPRLSTAAGSGRAAAVNGGNGSAGASLPVLVYRDREIAFFEGLVCRVGPPL